MKASVFWAAAGFNAATPEPGRSSFHGRGRLAVYLIILVECNQHGISILRDGIAQFVEINVVDCDFHVLALEHDRHVFAILRNG
jgi:hypothetical protein